MPDNTAVSAADPPHSKRESSSNDTHIPAHGFSDDESDIRTITIGGSLIPPTNFGIVEEDLYRSGMPNELNFPFLERLQLRTIIYLSTEDPSDKFSDFIDDHDIHVINLSSTESITPWKPMDEELVLSAMEILLDGANYPIYVLCRQGRHRTGTVIGCMRKLQMWSLSSIFEEYHRHAEMKGRLQNEQFIELFDTDLIHVPAGNRPGWYRSAM